MRRRTALGLLAAIGLAQMATGEGTVAQFRATTGGPVNTFSAASSFCPTMTAPAKISGFEPGVINANLWPTASGATVDPAVARNGGYSARINKTSGGIQYVGENAVGSVVVLSFALRLETLPAADVASLVSTSNAGSQLYLGFQAASRKLTIRWGTQPPALFSAPVSAAGWYSIDLKIDTSASPRTAEWRVDGLTGPAVSVAEGPVTLASLQLGSLVSSDVFTANADDYFRSSSASDYPIGPVRVLALRPNSMGNHNAPANFQKSDGTAIDATAFQWLTESPMDSVADGVRQVTASSTSYLELNFADTLESCIKGVQAVVAQHKTASQANTMRSSVFVGGTQRGVYSGDSGGSGAAVQRTAIVAPTTSSWTRAAVNSLVARIGYSTDASPAPYWDSFLLEYAVPVPATIPYPARVLNDSPVSYWRLGEASGTLAADQTSTNPGSYTGGLSLGVTGALAGDSDTAVALDGSTGHVRAADSASLNFTRRFSIEAWVNPDTVTTSAYVLQKNGNYGIYLSNNVTSFGFRSGGVNRTLQVTGLVIPGQWQHLVGTYDGTRLVLYRNGVKAAELAITGPVDTSTLPLYIGALSPTQTLFDGALDEVAVFTVALTAAQVQAHYVAGS